MDELTFLLILAGIGVVLLVAMYTYYKHHKKINDEIKNFNYHGHTIDDVLLDERSGENINDKDDMFYHDLPNSFSASRQDHFDIDDVQLKHDSVTSDASADSSSIVKTPVNERELVDGVYIHTKRVISTNGSTPHSQSTQTSKPANSYTHTNVKTEIVKTEIVKTEITQDSSIASEQLKTEVSPSMSKVSGASETADSTSISHNYTAAEMTEEPVIASQTQSKTNNQSNIKKNTPTLSQTINVVYDPVPEGVKELIISHTILSKGEYFTGRQLFDALESAGLFYGEMDIYHYPGDDSAETFALFSVANVVEPGTFNPHEAEALTTPGISMFMRLPTRIASYDAYEKFIHVAQNIAADLGGELCDETRSQLTQQAITYKKEQIRKLNFDMAKAEKLAGTTR